MLESIMRLISPEFLARSIGPTISRIEQVAKADTPLIVDGKPDRVAVERVWKLIEGCWSDMYGRLIPSMLGMQADEIAARGSLPASVLAQRQSRYGADYADHYKLCSIICLKV